MSVLLSLDDDDDVDSGPASQASQFFVIVTLETDKEQRALLDYLMDEGYRCQALAL